MTEVEKFFIDKCIKKITNRFPSMKVSKGIIERQWYRHPDLDNMSKDAFNEGEPYFYCEPFNPDNPNGKQIQCEPNYVYECVVNLSEKEFEELKKKCK